MKYVFVYPDRYEPDMTKLSLPAGFRSDKDAVEAAKDMMKLYPPFYSRIMVIKTDGDGHADLVADLVTAGQTDTFPYAFQGIYCQKLGEMVFVS